MTPDFNTWHADLISDTRWYEQVTMKYKGTFKTACEKLYGLSMSDHDLFSRPIQAQRTHLFNILWKMPVEQKNWVQTHQVEEKKEDKTWKPVSWEERAQWLAKWKEIHEKSPLVQQQWRSRLTINAEEEGQERPKATPFHRSELETRLAALQAVRDAQAARRKMYLEAFPDSSEEEIAAYIGKWSHIDNPDQL